MGLVKVEIPSDLLADIHAAAPQTLSRATNGGREHVRLWERALRDVRRSRRAAIRRYDFARATTLENVCQFVRLTVTRLRFAYGLGAKRVF